MNVAPKPQRDVLSLIDQTLAGRSIITELKESLTSSINILLTEKYLLQQRTNYLAEGMRTHLRSLLGDHLQPLGYADDFEKNQCRLLCSSEEREAIRLRWCLGNIPKGGSHAKLNAPKGLMTTKGVHQNAEHWGQPTFPFAKRPASTPKEANLWLLYQFDIKHEYLTAWIVFPDRIIGGDRMTYLDSKEILSKSFLSDPEVHKSKDTPTFKPKDDDFDMPFGVKMG